MLMGLPVIVAENEGKFRTTYVGGMIKGIIGFRCQRSLVHNISQVFLSGAAVKK